MPVDLAQTREWNNYQPGFNFYRVNGVKIEFYPVEAEIANANAKYLGGYSATSTATANTVDGNNLTRDRL